VVHRSAPSVLVGALFKNFSNLFFEENWSCSKAVYKPVRHVPLLSVQWINSWWWTDELPETCRVSWQINCASSWFYYREKKCIMLNGSCLLNSVLCW
jgi:hypothetical protein